MKDDQISPPLFIVFPQNSSDCLLLLLVLMRLDRQKLTWGILSDSPPPHPLARFPPFLPFSRGSIVSSIHPPLWRTIVQPGKGFSNRQFVRVANKQWTLKFKLNHHLQAKFVNVMSGYLRWVLSSTTISLKTYCKMQPSLGINPPPLLVAHDRTCNNTHTIWII